MANERSEHKAYDFWFLFEKFNKDLKSYFQLRNGSFVLALRYYPRSKLVFTSFCFQYVPKPELTSAARIMDRNSQKWSQKGYHSLPFAMKVSNRRSFKQTYSLNNRHGSFPHHLITTM